MRRGFDSDGLICAIFNWLWEKEKIEKYVEDNYLKIEPTEFLLMRDRDVGATFLRKNPEWTENLKDLVIENDTIVELLNQVRYPNRYFTDIKYYLELEIGRVIKATGYIKNNKEKILENRKKFNKCKKVINA